MENGIVIDTFYRRCCRFGDDVIGRSTTFDSVFPGFNRRALIKPVE